MNSQISSGDLERFVDGACSPEEAEHIAAALDNDPSMRRQVERLRKLNDLLRSTAMYTEAPSSLRDAVNARYASTPARAATESTRARTHRSPRRSFLLGASGVMAAGLAAAVVAPKFGLHLWREPSAVDTFFRDFETYLLKDKALDIAESDMQRLAGWYRERLPLPLPDLRATGSGVELTGGRLCWLLERRLASLSFEASDGELVLYIMDAQDISIPAGVDDDSLGKVVSTHRSSGNSSLVWKSGKQLFIMVGTLQAERLLVVARSLVG